MESSTFSKQTALVKKSGENVETEIRNLEGGRPRCFTHVYVLFFFLKRKKGLGFNAEPPYFFPLDFLVIDIALDETV